MRTRKSWYGNGNVGDVLTEVTLAPLASLLSTQLSRQCGLRPLALRILPPLSERCKKHWAWLAGMHSMVSIVSMMNKVSMVSMVRMGSLLELFMLPHTMKYLGFDQCLILRTQISPVTLFSNPGRSLRLKWENHYFPMCLENRWVWHLFQKVDRISRFWPLLAIFTHFSIFTPMLLWFAAEFSLLFFPLE